jgi:ribosomal-protein-alanine N-acetyltransferase
VPLELETARLRLRVFVPEDWRAVHAYLSAPGVRDFVPQWPATAEQTREFVRESAGDPPRRYAVVLRDTNAVAGHLDFHPWFGPQTFEIGWVVSPEHQGRGHATEGALRLLAHGFDVLGLHRVVATCQPQNTQSVRVMEKLGLRREAHFRKCMLAPDGSWWDEYLYALLDEDWAARGT